MTNVVDINHRCTPAVAASPDQCVISQLEWLLEAARSGEVQGVTGAFLFRDGIANSFTVGWRTSALVGSLDLVKHKVVRDMIEDNP